MKKDVNTIRVEDRLGHDRKYMLDSRKLKFYYNINGKDLIFKHIDDYLTELY
jgi:dTDP-D-glucose 4,6-dehydratase